MRLHTFISEHMEAILQEWENFARDVWPDANPGIPDLRDHAQEILLAIINDMQTTQSDIQHHDKSAGRNCPSAGSGRINATAARHAQSRLESGFDIRTLMAEYRSLRANVLHLWSQKAPTTDAADIQDITRFNKCVDQLLAESVLCYSKSVDHSRELLLGILIHDLRSPLCVVSMIAGSLEEKGDLSNSAREMTSLIQDAAREMKYLVADLLDFAGSHLEVKMHAIRQSTNLEDLCRKVVEEIRAAHPSRDFDPEASGDGNGEWDRSRLRQVISNLLANSERHGDADGELPLGEADGGTVADAEGQPGTGRFHRHRARCIMK